MNHTDFEKIIAPLTARWPKAYTPEIIGITYRGVRHLQAYELERVVERFLATARSAPTASEMVKAASEINARQVHDSDMPRYRKDNGPLYAVREGVNANDAYVFMPGKTVAECRFIIMADSPDHPLVIEAKAKRADNPQRERYVGMEGFKTLSNPLAP